MANLDTTEKLKAIAKAEGAAASAEIREGSNATSKLLFSNEGVAFQNAQALKTSLSQPTEAVLLQETTLAVKNNKEACLASLLISKSAQCLFQIFRFVSIRRPAYQPTA